MPTVVVVHDEPTVAVTLAEILVRHKLDAVWFIHPGEALEFLQRTKVNLLLTGINMPHADGISLAECVHAIQSTCFLFVFSASAHDPSVRDRVEKSGLPVYLEAKPLHPRYLVQTIHTMLSRIPHPSAK